MYALMLLPANQPSRGMANWNAPNQMPSFTAWRQEKPRTEMPLDTETANASMAKLTAMNNISSTTLPPDNNTYQEFMLLPCAT